MCMCFYSAAFYLHSISMSWYLILLNFSSFSVTFCSTIGPQTKHSNLFLSLAASFMTSPYYISLSLIFFSMYNHVSLFFLPLVQEKGLYSYTVNSFSQHVSHPEPLSFSYHLMCWKFFSSLQKFHISDSLIPF